MNRSDIVQHICDLTLAELIEKTKVCPHAWNGLYMGPDGNVKMCTRNRAMLGDAIIKQSSEYRSYDDLVNSSVQLDASKDSIFNGVSTRALIAKVKTEFDEAMKGNM